MKKVSVCLCLIEKWGLVPNIMPSSFVPESGGRHRTHLLGEIRLFSVRMVQKIHFWAGGIIEAILQELSRL